ncbi:Serine hydrolase-like protein [Lachnellula hyalina]|uniref:Serine hydrolase-like protein n=1 Tax=Lachnellula hyalina TaxID=1316788 RepID=A0A8H8TWW1_9HELO|nr:Serine hydrolase-like protein [Lachnellula hyalina]TVY24882.1 Serine hydrolase-like protein [Lachnellula hyalina]
MTAFIYRLPRLEPRNLALVGTSVATTLALVAITRYAFHSAPPKTIPSPRTAVLLILSKEEQDALPYPPDAFPGARDVASPYGIFRAYEFGPEQGRKVLLIHGISTPCLSLGGIANALVSKGCRVLLLDLWGRGYSDSVDLPHDSRLYTSQILLAITSSPLSWTPEGFSIIGYSLGGGIAADFASSFPNLVRGLVLLAPSGLIRKNHFGWQSRLLYSGLLPTSLLETLIRRRLGGGSSNASSVKQDDLEKAVQEEMKGNSSQGFDNTPLNKDHPSITVGGATDWQLANHEGFVRSFVSSIRFASIEYVQGRWRNLGRLKEKIIIMAGETDPIIIADELHKDSKEEIGAEKVEFKVIRGGHEFPIARPDEVVEEIVRIWGI